MIIQPDKSIASGNSISYYVLQILQDAFWILIHASRHFFINNHQICNSCYRFCQSTILNNSSQSPLFPRELNFSRLQKRLLKQQRYFLVILQKITHIILPIDSHHHYRFTNNDNCWCLCRTIIFTISQKVFILWWRHQMETFSASLALCAGYTLVTGEFPSQRPVTGSFDIFFDLRLNKQLSKQSWGWWFETPSSPLWRQCNVIMDMMRNTTQTQ